MELFDRDSNYLDKIFHQASHCLIGFDDRSEKILIDHYLFIVERKIRIIIRLFAPKTSLDNIEMFRIPEQEQSAFCSVKTPGILKADSPQLHPVISNEFSVSSPKSYQLIW